ncbi:MAG TPA: DUF1538 domain-containing protein [Clostridiales bacterium]|nr:DUF1538 domain-containing protein [Clostridiales bacterium]
MQLGFKNLNKKLFESAMAVLPITLLVIFLGLGFDEVKNIELGLFAFGAVMLTLGMAFFTLGADMAIMEIGREIGANLAANKKFLMFLIPLVLGFFVAFSEPDIQILGELFQTKPGEKNMTIIIVVSVAVAIMLLIAILRANYNWRLRIIFLIAYSIIFVLGILVEIYTPYFVPTAFDSGGIATGPMLVPFLLAFGVGFSNAKGGKNQSQNSFGVLGLATAGPIMAVLLMALILKPDAQVKQFNDIVLTNFNDILKIFGSALPEEFKLVAIALAPTVIIFLIFQFTTLKLPRQSFLRILIGAVYTFFGLSIFLAAASSCFSPVGRKLGFAIASKSFKWILIPLGFLIGAMIAFAEPSIHILAKQVDTLTGGSVSKRFMLIALCTGIGLAVVLAMIRILTSIKIWWFLVPTYVISIGLMFFVEPIFTAIAFDSGSAASGAIVATFALPFALGASSSVGGNPLLDAFGIVAYVSMIPILLLQLTGVVYKIKTAAIQKKKLVPATEDISSHPQVEPNNIDAEKETDNKLEDDKVAVESVISNEQTLDEIGDEPIDFD